MAKYFPVLAEAFGRLRTELAGRPIAIIGHARPDGDCIGSQVALARVLAAAGHDVICVNADPVPRRLTFLTQGLTFYRTDDVLAHNERRAAIYVDCADHARAGERLKAHYATPAACVDHHLSNGGFATLNLIDAGAAATCEILAGMFLDAGLPIDALTAQALYTGIVTDTGQFRFPATSHRCFLLAGELVERGASPAVVGYELYERETAGKLQLLQRFLASLRVECEGRVCIGRLPAGIFAETGTSGEDTEGMVDYARSIEGVDIGVLIEERPEGVVKASLRAKDAAYRMDRIAAAFQGGGHACAAGLSIKMDTKEFHTRLLDLLREQIRVVASATKET